MSRKLLYVTGLILVLCVGQVWASHDVTGPGDVIRGVPNDGTSTDNSTNGWPGNEGPNQSFDNQITTKYLHFKGEREPTGVQVTPKAGPSIVTEVRFCTANDAVERDPVSWELYGSNTAIDGPYTLIAKGAIVDFAAGTWARRTWNTTQIKFANAVEYKHYQVMFPTIYNAGTANSMQIAEIELLSPDFKATAPNPPSGSIITMPFLQWSKGDTAQFHNVYFGTSKDLTAADLKAANSFQTFYYHMTPMEPGVLYYWRVDEVALDGTVYTGDVWTVMVAPKKAYNPKPRNGDKWLPVNSQLTWTPGANAVTHDLYFGTDKAAVTARAASVSKGSTGAVFTFDPGPLQQNTTYYWAVDETDTMKAKVAGDVWSFTTVGAGGGARGDYFAGTTPSGTPVLSRIDAEINVNLTGTTSPGGTVPGDGWSARWTADLDIAVADTYYFSINCQDGTKMWVDNELIIDKWVTPTVTSEYFSLPVTLAPGIHSLRVEFFDSGGDAVEQLYWWSDSNTTKVILPAGPLQPPMRATAAYPSDAAVGVPQDATLVWGAGDKAAKHAIYLGKDKDAVANATPETAGIFQAVQDKGSESFTPGSLDWNTTYYWRIDEINDATAGSPWKGNVWSFTTADFLVVDDMESYDDADNRIYDSWLDNFGDEPGAIVGNDPAPFAEQVTVHGGKQSMPLMFNNAGPKHLFSETVRTFDAPQNWTVNGVKTLSLWVRGYPALANFAVTETAGKISLTGSGTDIWNSSDQFSFAYKTLNGDGTIVARVTSNGTGSNTWAKGGVMIRDSLDGNSTFANMVLTGANTAGNGASFQYRLTTAAGCANTDAAVALTPPYWVKIQRIGDNLAGYISADGKTWTLQGAAQTIAMTNPVYIGLCVTSHTAAEERTYQFDSISTTGSVSGAWQGAKIETALFNAAAGLYVTVEDSSAKKFTVSDATAANSASWFNVKFPLSSFTGVNAAKVKKLSISVGDPKTTTPGGAGKIFLDDICVVK